MRGKEGRREKGREEKAKRERKTAESKGTRIKGQERGRLSPQRALRALTWDQQDFGVLPVALPGRDCDPFYEGGNGGSEGLSGAHP